MPTADPVGVLRPGRSAWTPSGPSVTKSVLLGAFALAFVGVAGVAAGIVAGVAVAAFTVGSVLVSGLLAFRWEGYHVYEDRVLAYDRLVDEAQWSLHYADLASVDVADGTVVLRSTGGGRVELPGLADPTTVAETLASRAGPGESGRPE